MVAANPRTCMAIPLLGVGLQDGDRLLIVDQNETCGQEASVTWSLTVLQCFTSLIHHSHKMSNHVHHQIIYIFVCFNHRDLTFHLSSLVKLRS